MSNSQLQMEFSGYNFPKPVVDLTKPLVHKENNSESQAIFDGNIDHFSEQCKTLYKAFMRGERLTTTRALIDYGIGDLRRRVKDLIDNYGVHVDKETKEGRYKEYFININS
ncbi:helix-turn-helix domain-containing protein [Flavobacterium sp. 25HG05S-40]|uniref:helix-turn-helix domain-containing protein n=1 Tax=Flavobacterium sp. 25HG05S-40 TaxID=3458682 RepID=UPI004043F721